MQSDRKRALPVKDNPELRDGDSLVRRSLETALGIDLPQDYIDFVSRHDGVGGFIGKSYVQFFPVERLVVDNKELGVDQYVPDLVAFASDGAGELYAFDKRFDPMRVVQIQPTSLALEDIITCARNFTEFLGYLERGGIQSLTF